MDEVVPGGCYGTTHIKPKRTYKGVLFDVGEVFQGTTANQLIEDHLRRCRSGEIPQWQMTEEEKLTQYYKTAKKRRYPVKKYVERPETVAFDQGSVETKLSKLAKEGLRPHCIVVGAGLAVSEYVVRNSWTCSSPLAVGLVVFYRDMRRAI